MIEEALGADAAWRVLAPDAAHVATRELPEGSGLVVPPMGAPRRQPEVRAAQPASRPVSVRAVSKGANRFSIVNVKLGTDPTRRRRCLSRSSSPPRNSLTSSDAEKLSRRSFEPFEAGVEIAGGSAPSADAQKHVDVVYEVIYVRKPRRPLLFRLRDAILDLLVAGSAAGRSKLSAERTAPTGLGTPEVAFRAKSSSWQVSTTSRLMAPQRFSSQSAAMAALKVAVANDAQLTNRLQVVSPLRRPA